jgi:hypothetical protein
MGSPRGISKDVVIPLAQGVSVPLTEDNCTCAICSMKFVVADLHEALAAHIVPKTMNGTDDPRTGLTLCRAHHRAFDAGEGGPCNPFALFIRTFF